MKYRVTAHSICNLKYSAPKKILRVIHNGSNYNYHFIIDDLIEYKCLHFNENYRQRLDKMLKKQVLN